ncbi:MAG: hypothetical protein EXR49_04025 [Dehalococcoidia bacterium]|nr:hypothetical protein [Dehalococcoidia bacterium]
MTEQATSPPPIRFKYVRFFIGWLITGIIAGGVLGLIFHDLITWPIIGLGAGLSLWFVHQLSHAIGNARRASPPPRE